MSSVITTVKEFFISNIFNRPRVQISIVVTIIALFVVRFLWERSLRAVEKSITDKLAKNNSSNGKLLKSSSNSSNTRRVTAETTERKEEVETKSTVPTVQTSGEETLQKQQQQQQQRQEQGAASSIPKQADQSTNRIFGLGHERLGHVVTVRVKNEEHPDLESAAKQFASTLRGGSTPVLVVLRDTAGVQGELRQPTHTPLWMDKQAALEASKEIVSRILRRGKKLGVIANSSAAATTSSSSQIYQLSESTLEQLADSPTFTVHKEQSTKYSLDAARVMFCSGNTTERMHFGTNVAAAGETVVDMFAGIGYFTIPLASSANPANRPNRIIAIEKNPESCSYLACNALLNDCVDRVFILNGDNRTTGNLFVGKANRVLMGYIPCCKEFLPRAVSFLVQVPNNAPFSEQGNNNSAKTVSFAPGSTPPSSKTGKTNKVAIQDKDENSNSNGNNENDDEETKKETAATSSSSSSSSPATTLPTRPVGVIHYHYLSETKVKDEARATAQLHVLESLGPQLGSLCSIEELRVVKSYAPKKYHCVADLHFKK